MLRPCLTLGVLLAVGCDGSPTAPDAPRAPPWVGLTAEAVAAMHALLDDPFVHDVIAQSDNTRAVQHTMQEVMDRVAAGEPQALRRALTEAHRKLRQSPNVEAVVARAALGFTLGAVTTVLDSVTKAETVRGETIPLDLRGGDHD